MLAKTEKAKEFRAFVRKLIKSIRMGESDFSALSPQLQFMIQMEKKQNELECRQQELESKFADISTIQENAIKATFEFGRIGALQRLEIQKAVKKRAIELCKYAETYDKVGKRVVSGIYKALQKHFDVSSYLDLTYHQYTDAIIFIQYFEPDLKMDMVITKNMPKPNLELLSALDITCEKSV